MQFDRIKSVVRGCYARQQQRVPAHKDGPDISSGCSRKDRRIFKQDITYLNGGPEMIRDGKIVEDRASGTDGALN